MKTVIILGLIFLLIILGILAFCAYAIRKESEKRLLNKKDIIPIANADCDTEYDD